MSDLPDFVALAARYKNLTPGQKAELRRLADPEEAGGKPAFYRLFPGQQATPQRQRLAFLLPWAEHRAGAKPLGAQLAQAKVSETRIYQMVRSEPENDLIQLRRLLQHAKPALDWEHFGKTLHYWGAQSKRQILEQFFIHQPTDTTA